MRLSEGMTNQVRHFLKNTTTLGVREINHLIESKYGIRDFFKKSDDWREIRGSLTSACDVPSDLNRSRQYGDFQTPKGLSDDVIQQLADSGCSPKQVIEPTCGKGNFIVSALKQFDEVQEVWGVEVFKPYVYFTQFAVLDLLMSGELRSTPKITILHQSFFDFDLDTVNKGVNTLIVGNPPWVTNSELGEIGSKNLPKKSNFKESKGLDAITGKGNFDIGEFITLELIKRYQTLSGSTLALLLKNSVIKNIIHDQYHCQYAISEVSSWRIDAKKEFGANVEASLLWLVLGQEADIALQEYNFYDKSPGRKIGWSKNQFYADLNKYDSAKVFDGKCQLEWRSGLKHDCSRVMELTPKDGVYANKLGEKWGLEEDLLYPLAKGSSLKDPVHQHTGLVTIVTQKRIGQCTDFISRQHPLTHAYLEGHGDYFARRKSKVYQGKSPYAIFGVGDYTFFPFKVCIAGLYKKWNPCFVAPLDGKPVVPDDTCYFLSFESDVIAAIVFALLSSENVRRLMEAITFEDSMRRYSKDVLMR